MLHTRVSYDIVVFLCFVVITVYVRPSLLEIILYLIACYYYQCRTDRRQYCKVSINTDSNEITNWVQTLLFAVA